MCVCVVRERERERETETNTTVKQSGPLFLGASTLGAELVIIQSSPRRFHTRDGTASSADSEADADADADAEITSDDMRSTPFTRGF